MFGLFRRRTNDGGAKPTIAAVHFDSTGYTFEGELQPGGLRVWRTPDGDGLGVYFFQVAPDLPAGAASTDQLEAFYRDRLTHSGGKLIEVRVVVAGGCPAVRTIFSLPQQPFGRAYVGSLTLPFRDFSFVLKCQCLEDGLTGLKEALLMDRSWAATESEQSTVSMNDPDAPAHDAEFPGHPVARVRRVLDHVQGTLAVQGSVRTLPSFALPL